MKRFYLVNFFKITTCLRLKSILTDKNNSAANVLPPDEEKKSKRKEKREQEKRRPRQETLGPWHDT